MTHRNILICALDGFSDLGKKDKANIISDYDAEISSDLSGDPITAIAVNAVTNNPDDLEQMYRDLDYAISELKRVQLAIERIIT